MKKRNIVILNILTGKFITKFYNLQGKSITFFCASKAEAGNIRDKALLGKDNFSTWEFKIINNRPCIRRPKKYEFQIVTLTDEEVKEILILENRLEELKIWNKLISQELS